eukprot:10357110-Karenia_brevis.AAC.1
MELDADAEPLPSSAIASQEVQALEKHYEQMVTDLGSDHVATKHIKEDLDKAKSKASGHAQLKNTKQLADA